MKLLDETWRKREENLRFSVLVPGKAPGIMIPPLQHADPSACWETRDLVAAPSKEATKGCPPPPPTSGPPARYLTALGDAAQQSGIQS